MGLLNLSKSKPLRLSKIRTKIKGERGLTSADKKKEKKRVNYICQKCRKKFPEHLLDVHHIKHISSYKSKGLDVPTYEFYDKRKKRAHQDRSKNLMVLCPTCHRIIHNEESNKKKLKKKPKKKNPYGLGW